MLKTWVWDAGNEEGSEWMLSLGQECLGDSRPPPSLASFLALIPYVLLDLASHNQTFCLQSLSSSCPPNFPSSSHCDKLGRFMEGQSLLPALR